MLYTRSFRALGFCARPTHVWISGRSYMSNLMFDYAQLSLLGTCLSRGRICFDPRGCSCHSDCIRDSGVLCFCRVVIRQSRRPSPSRRVREREEQSVFPYSPCRSDQTNDLHLVRNKFLLSVCHQQTARLRAAPPPNTPFAQRSSARHSATVPHDNGSR